MNIIQAVGGRNGRSGTTKNALNVASVMCFAPKAACSRVRMVFSRRIWIIAKAAAFARMNAGPAQSR